MTTVEQPAGPRRTALLPTPTRVVELGESVSTALAGRLLHKLGAEVVRLRPVGSRSELAELGPRIGEGETDRSAVEVWLDDGKTVLDVDLAAADGNELFDTHVRGADVILIAGTSAEWSARGRSLPEVHALAPTAVIGHLTHWGDEGPYSERLGGELQLQAQGGLMNLIGVREREPVRLGGYPVQAASGLLALDGVLIGLFRRRRTGQGARFSTSDFESVAHLEWKIAANVQAGRRKELRGEDGGGPVVVRASDGHFALFFVPKNWADVKKLIGDPRLDDERFATDRARAQRQGELASIIEETTRSMPKKILYQRAQALGIPAGHVATMSDLLTSPQYRTRNLFDEVALDGIGVGELPNAPWQVLTLDDERSPA